MALGKLTALSVLPRKGEGSFYCGIHQRGACRQIACVSWQERPTGHGDGCPLLRLILLSLLHVNKVLFYPVLDCTVFPLVTPTQRCMGSSMWSPPPVHNIPLSSDFYFFFYLKVICKSYHWSFEEKVLTFSSAAGFRWCRDMIRYDFSCYNSTWLW